VQACPTEHAGLAIYATAHMGRASSTPVYIMINFVVSFG